MYYADLAGCVSLLLFWLTVVTVQLILCYSTTNCVLCRLVTVQLIVCYVVQYKILCFVQTWSPDVYLSWGCGRQLLQYNSAQVTREACEDISIKMKRRALKGYGIQVSLRLSTISYLHLLPPVLVYFYPCCVVDI